MVTSQTDDPNSNSYIKEDLYFKKEDTGRSMSRGFILLLHKPRLMGDNGVYANFTLKDLETGWKYCRELVFKKYFLFITKLINTKQFDVP